MTIKKSLFWLSPLSVVLTLSIAGIPLPAARPPVLKLLLKDPKVFQIQEVPQNGLILPVRCDDGGNVYFRSQVGDYAIGDSVTKVSADGKKLAVFRLSSIPDLKNVRGQSFTVGRNGEFHQVIHSQEGLFLVAFDNGGGFRWKQKLDSAWDIYELQSVPPDAFFISGINMLGDKGKTIFNLFLNESGQVLKSLALKSEKRELASEGDVPYPAVQLGSSAIDPSGDIYLLRASTNPTVYVISPAGKVLRTMQVPPPFEDSKTVSLKLNSGRMLVQYESKHIEETGGYKHVHVVFSVFNSESGERMIDYDIAPEVGGALACYTPAEFTFLTGDGSKMAVLKVNAK